MSSVVVLTEHEPSLPASNGVSGDALHPNKKVDIEHVTVQDDPRLWSKTRKNVILGIIASAAMIGTLCGNIYNPAIKEIQTELHATNQEISLSLSLFIILQGAFPFLWSAITEIKGRKIVYLASVTLFVAGCVILATAKSIGLVIGMRCIQAAGASAVLNIGAATLADIYEPHERGTMMGIYYAAPLLGPSLGPLLGGILTQFFNWRATFWFLTIFGALSLASFVFFKDTFRRERSLAYQAAAARHASLHAAHRPRDSKRSSQVTIAVPDANNGISLVSSKLETGMNSEKEAVQTDAPPNVLASTSIGDLKLSLRDINPFGALVTILRRLNNVAILFASGLMFAFSYSITYTCSRTFAASYNYNALQIGLVLLAFGLGSMAGSILGGRWSDRVLVQLKAKNGGQGSAEMRLESTKYAMPFLPLSCLAYAWLCQEKIHVAAVCTALFFCGFFSIWIYSSTLAYIVDANTGRSSSAVAANSMFRGTTAFIAAEVAVPLQVSIGDGGLYTIWTGLLVITELIVLLVIWKGGEWRERGHQREETTKQ